MHETVTVTRLGKGSSYYEVATTARKDGTSGSLGAFTKELEALQFASRHCEQQRGAADKAILELTDEQRELLAQGAPAKSAPAVLKDDSD